MIPVGTARCGGIKEFGAPDVPVDMRKTRCTGMAGDEPRSQVMAMVDISFLLLIFFVVNSTILRKEADLPVVLPRPGESEPVPALPVWVSIAADGTVAMGRDEGAVVMADAGTRELSGHLELARDAMLPETLPVMMDVADGASHDRFIEVLDCLAGLGIGEVTMVERDGGF